MRTLNDAPGAAFPRLFTPLRVGGATLKNRIVSSGHDTVMADHGQISDRLIAYQEARARGGVGLIVVQVAGSPRDRPLHHPRPDGRRRRLHPRLRRGSPRSHTHGTAR